MSGQYAAMYRRAREALETDAEIRLERPLTPHERNLLRNCGTLTMLDSIGMIIYSAQSADDLADRLASTSMDSRFALAVRELLERLKRFMGRPITDVEQQHIYQLGNIEELWTLEEQLQTATLDALDNREMAFQSLLATISSR